jgi:predicted HicB family RNase H-like nuclease
MPHIGIAVDDELYEQCKAAAQRDGRTLASWVRWTLQQAAKEVKQ